MTHRAFAAVIVFFAVLIAPQWAKAQDTFDCSSPANASVALILKPMIEKAKLCKGLKQKVDAGLVKVKLKVDQTRAVRVESLHYCTSSTSRKIEGRVAVECATDEGSEVQIDLSEGFDVVIEIDNKTCAVTNFTVEPEGDIGKLIAKNTDFEGMVRKAVEHEIAKACSAS